MQEVHLFVLVHGLWGGANHLKSIDDLIHLNVVDSEEEIRTLRPRTSSLFKTYDGIEIIGHRMLLEVLEEINSLASEEEMRVTKISFVGYSLGGLVSRYIIGELEKIGLFDVVEPVFFTTFATPHLGVRFFKKKFQPLNFMLATLIGKVGSELAIKDEDKMLVKLTEGEYYSGLQKFKERFCFANIRHDRTVNFFTSYITDKNPFNDHWDKLDLSFEFGEDIIPEYKVRGITVTPKIVNLQDSTFQEEGTYTKRAVPLWKKFRYVGIVALMCCIFPIWLPIVFTVSSIGSIASSLIVKCHKSLTPDELKKLIELDKMGKSPSSSTNYKRRDSETGSTFRERLDEATSEAFENAINVSQYDTHTESAKDNTTTAQSIPLFASVYNRSTTLMREASRLFKNPDISKYEIFKSTTALPLDDDRKSVMERLNALDWHKFAVYVNVLNAHDGIVARKGLKRSTAKGVAVVAFWSEMVNEHLKNES